ncbi:hypothetical protein H7K13_23710 [Priestia aryabhattai]|uniref:hypothetical protein n=1 Tax=Priestia aryabhattai TaxID=412384 RepID=UPI001C8D29B8|nr:hypothetical protein [Priestia aryabhattai]MBY0077937.1 hypothetical protein [Priestia aryabhattai]
MDGHQIAKNTLLVLGGTGKLGAMLGAKNFNYDQKGKLTFQFKLCQKANMVSFELDCWDLYKITFYRFSPRKCELKEVKVFEGLYVEQIRNVFTDFTGLDLSL